MNKNIARRMVEVLLSMLLQGLCLFISAWTIKWFWAWALLSVSILIIIFNSRLLPPELIEERGKKKDDAKRWDKILTRISIIPMLGINIIAGLDYRFAWSGNTGNAVNIAGLALYFCSSMFVTWSMLSNKFFSTMVRIQGDRNHQVATQGPYKYIRHPGYLGFIIMMLSMPLALGALYGLTMSAVSGLLFIIRTSLEDKTLHDELPGYAEYAQNVKYKLIPLIW